MRELELMLEIDRVCKKHNLRYFLMCGTLLGAIRHKGFIPWDDDADLAMPREDYEKFFKSVDFDLNETISDAMKQFATEFLKGGENA